MRIALGGRSSDRSREELKALLAEDEENTKCSTPECNNKALDVRDKICNHCINDSEPGHGYWEAGDY